MTEDPLQAQIKQPNNSPGRVTRIDVLPDDVLLGIFDFFVDARTSHEQEWLLLVHVCRRWRTLVFGSPRRLNLRLLCTAKTPARDTLDVWPALPLIIQGDMDPTSDTGNVVAALGQNNCIREVVLWSIEGWQLQEVSAAMRVPFPELTYLQLSAIDETAPVIPDSFLHGSAPRLRSLMLSGIPFPGLSKLHLSATHLVALCLSDIPHAGYISPEAMVALISVLSNLESFVLRFRSSQSRPDRETRRPPPLQRSVIPALTVFYVKGAIEYLEDLVTGIDTPQLDCMEITFFSQIDFDTPRLAQFINRTPKLGKRDATVQFYDGFSRVQLSPGSLEIVILCGEPVWQLSSIEQVCNSSLQPLSTVEDLYIEHRYRELVWEDDVIEDTLWLQLLLPFTAVKNLYLSEEFTPGIAAALQELVEGIRTEVLPTLQNIFVKGLDPSGPFQKNIGQFVAARQLSNHPITISVWDKDH